MCSLQEPGQNISYRPMREREREIGGNAGGRERRRVKKETEMQTERMNRSLEYTNMQCIATVQELESRKE